MTKSGKSSPSSILDPIKSGTAAQQAVEQAIQKALQNFVTTADTEIAKLVKSNSLPPDVADDMLKLHKTTIEQTINAIKAGPLGVIKQK